MIVLGNSEPSLLGPREIRRETVALSSLLDSALTDDAPNVIITVPAASMMITLDTTPDRVGHAGIYYECDPETSGTVSLEIHALGPGGRIPETARLLGHFWYIGSLIAVYAKELQA